MTKQERNELVKKLKRLRWETCDLLAEAFNELNKMPEIVRCKECKYNYANMIPNGKGCQQNVYIEVSDNFFCADGEREG